MSSDACLDQKALKVKEWRPKDMSLAMQQSTKLIVDRTHLVLASGKLVLQKSTKPGQTQTALFICR